MCMCKQAKRASVSRIKIIVLKITLSPSGEKNPSFAVRIKALSTCDLFYMCMYLSFFFIFLFFSSLSLLLYVCLIYSIFHVSLAFFPLFNSFSGLWYVVIPIGCVDNYMKLKEAYLNQRSVDQIRLFKFSFHIFLW